MPNEKKKKIEAGIERVATQMQELQNDLPQTDEEQLRRAMAEFAEHPGASRIARKPG